MEEKETHRIGHFIAIGELRMSEPKHTPHSLLGPVAPRTLGRDIHRV